MARIFVGNLPGDIKESELDDLFYKYGRIKDIDLKNPPRPPKFAFITFENSLDAEDAVRGRDNYNFDGYRIRCEFARGEKRGGGRFEEPRRRTGGRRTDYGVVVTNLPRRASWQDLKDFMRKAGDVVYADVDRNGEGVVEFSNRDDMDNAIKTLDDTEFKSRDDSSYVRVKAAKRRGRSRSEGSNGRGGGNGDRAEDRGRERSRSNDRSRSRERKRSPSRSPSASPAREGGSSKKHAASEKDREEDRRED